MNGFLHCSNDKGLIQALHGFGGDGEDFSLVRTCSQFDWCCMDLLGHGASPKSTNAEEYNVRNQAAQVSGQKSGEILLGYSMGGRLALHTVLEHPRQWKALILISATAGIREGRGQRQVWDQELARRLRNSTNKEFWDYWSQVPIIQSQRNLDVDFQQKRDVRRGHAYLGSLAASVLGFGAGVMPSVWHRLHEIDMPVLLIVGQEDQKYFQLGVELKACITKSELHVVPDCGHAPHLEQPDAVAAIIDGWINSLLL